jgi:hypothetical protein
VARAAIIPSWTCGVCPAKISFVKGCADLSDGIQSPAALLVSIGAPRIRWLGVEVPNPIPSSELRLYALLTESDGDAAHGRYNALVRRLVNFERALACGRQSMPPDWNG